MHRTTPPNNWTSTWKARRAELLAVDEPELELEPVEPFADLQARAKAAGVSAGGSRSAIEARLAALEAP